MVTSTLVQEKIYYLHSRRGWKEEEMETFSGQWKRWTWDEIISQVSSTCKIFWNWGSIRLIKIVQCIKVEEGVKLGMCTRQVLDLLWSRALDFLLFTLLASSPPPSSPTSPSFAPILSCPFCNEPTCLLAFCVPNISRAGNGEKLLSSVFCFP